MNSENIHTNSQSYPQSINNLWITLCLKFVCKFSVDIDWTNLLKKVILNKLRIIFNLRYSYKRYFW